MFKKLFKSEEEKALKKYEAFANNVIEVHEKNICQLTDEQLQEKTNEYIELTKNDQFTDENLVEAYAVFREASKRILGLEPFKVQIMGAMAMTQGDIAEMKTGEGKTLVAAMASYVNSFSKKGVHIVTVNEYLVKRDAQTMGEVLEFLGLSVAHNVSGMSGEEKRQAYKADVTYTTNSELGFDYLRDNMVKDAKARVLRGLNFAIVDEVDSILIDEARTPLIISGAPVDKSKQYRIVSDFTTSLVEGDYEIDETTKTVHLLDSGIDKVEKAFNIKTLYSIDNIELVQYINQALKARFIMLKDIDYAVVNGEIKIIDQYTGRIMEGRAYSDGLHQAIEAKEGVKIKEQTQTMATITYQNFFRLYDKLSGMTGTAKTEEEEFLQIYNMRVIVVPTNKPIAREDAQDLIFATKEAKFTALVDEVEQRHNNGQPILLGTIAVETSEYISNLLNKRGLKHEVLNAKNHEREADIIANAGELGAITIATNMAGRGTDIKLGEGVKEVGGLAVIGSEKHESRRIDNQLRGRSGRQGDVGYSRFYISTDDDLMRRFASDRIKKVMENFLESDEAIESKLITKSVTSAQKRVEASHYDSRKHVIKYDSVLQKQREIVYNQRDVLLLGENLEELYVDVINNVIKGDILVHQTEVGYDEDLLPALKELIQLPEINTIDLSKNAEELIQDVTVIANKQFEMQKEMFGEDFHKVQKIIALNILDNEWIRHIDSMTNLKEGIYLRSYAQTDPLVAYEEHGFELFEDFTQRMNRLLARFILNTRPVRKTVEGQEDKKLGRNDECPCGSGEKYKNCCGK